MWNRQRGQLIVSFNQYNSWLVFLPYETYVHMASGQNGVLEVQDKDPKTWNLKIIYLNLLYQPDFLHQHSVRGIQKTFGAIHHYK